MKALSQEAADEALSKWKVPAPKKPAKEPLTPEEVKRQMSGKKGRVQAKTKGFAKGGSVKRLKGKRII